MSSSEGRGWVADASVAVKWFLPPETEPDGDLARKLTEYPIKATSLTFYEVGNLLGRVPGSSSSYVDSCLTTMLRICGEAVGLEPADYRPSAELAESHGITFYDASYAVIAGRLGRRVVSADRDLLGPGLAVDLTTVAAL